MIFQPDQRLKFEGPSRWSVRLMDYRWAVVVQQRGMPNNSQLKRLECVCVWKEIFLTESESGANNQNRWTNKMTVTCRLARTVGGEKTSLGTGRLDACCIFQKVPIQTKSLMMNTLTWCNAVRVICCSSTQSALHMLTCTDRVPWPCVVRSRIWPGIWFTQHFSKHLLWVLISHDLHGCYDRSCEQAGTGSFAQQQFLQLLEHSHIL